MSLRLVAESTSLMLACSFSHSGLAEQEHALSQLTCSELTQSITVVEPSSTRRISPTLISSGGRESA